MIVIDDDDLVAQLVIEAASQVGFAGVAAYDFETFQRALAQQEPDLILIDLVLPNVDGIQILRFLADQDCKSNIILMSGFDPKVVQTAQRLGLSLGLKILGALSKPVSIASLKAEIKRSARDADNISEEKLRDAIETENLNVHFQPKVRIAGSPASDGQESKSGIVREGKTYDVVGFEALARWQLNSGKYVPPTVFVPLAEGSDIIHNLTMSVYRQVVQVLDNWKTRGSKLRASINISPHLLTNLELPDILLEEARAHDIETDQIVLELTETAAMTDSAHIMEVLSRFRLQGFGLSLDDFGTGYSSLIQIYRMPFTELKIDRSFVSEMETSDEAYTIVRSIVSLGHNLGMEVCAEGVETEVTSQMLYELGCDFGQGYYYSRPNSPEEISKLLQIPA